MAIDMGPVTGVDERAQGRRCDPTPQAQFPSGREEYADRRGTFWGRFRCTKAEQELKSG